MKRRNFLHTLLFGAAAISAREGIAAGPETLVADITALLRQTEAMWDARDMAGLRGLWDTEDPEPYYLAGEQDNWFIGWNEIDQYLSPQGAPKVIQAMRVRFYDISARRLSADLAFAAYWMRTDMKLAFSPKPFGSDNRVSAVLRKKPDGWRYLCYTEAFQAPNLYFQKLFEKDVSADFEVPGSTPAQK